MNFRATRQRQRQRQKSDRMWWNRILFWSSKPFSSDWPIAAGAFFFVKNDVFGQNLFPPAGPLPQAPFFWSKIAFLAKKNVFGSKMAFFWPFLAFLKQKQVFFTPLCSSSYRIVTNLDAINIDVLHFFQNLRVIWLSHRFQFFVDALPTRIWQVLLLFFGGPCGRRGTPWAQLVIPEKQ